MVLAINSILCHSLVVGLFSIVIYSFLPLHLSPFLISLKFSANTTSQSLSCSLQLVSHLLQQEQEKKLKARGLVIEWFGNSCLTSDLIILIKPHAAALLMVWHHLPEPTQDSPKKKSVCSSFWTNKSCKLIRAWVHRKGPLSPSCTVSPHWSVIVTE